MDQVEFYKKLQEVLRRPLKGSYAESVVISDVSSVPEGTLEHRRTACYFHLSHIPFEKFYVFLVSAITAESVQYKEDFSFWIKKENLPFTLRGIANFYEAFFHPTCPWSRLVEDIIQQEFYNHREMTREEICLEWQTKGIFLGPQLVQNWGYNPTVKSFAIATRFLRENRLRAYNFGKYMPEDCKYPWLWMYLLSDMASEGQVRPYSHDHNPWQHMHVTGNHLHAPTRVLAACKGNYKYIKRSTRSVKMYTSGSSEYTPIVDLTSEPMVRKDLWTGQLITYNRFREATLKDMLNYLKEQEAA